MEQEVLNWLKLADKMASDGDFKGMRACAREILAVDAKSVDGLATMGEAALYTGDLEQAEALSAKALAANPRHFKARLVQGGILAARFNLTEEIPWLKKLASELEQGIQELGAANEYVPLMIEMLKKADAWLADALYLGGEPLDAAKEILAYSNLCSDKLIKAEAYSKFLFMSNYREPPAKAKELACRYDKILGIAPASHANHKQPKQKLRVGYISPDFRNHAVAYFVAPLIKNFNREKFKVFIYSTGNIDSVTEKLYSREVVWRDLRGQLPAVAARIIASDKIDILVDLAGHTQSSNLPIMAYKAAPVQITGIGYMSTTGLAAIDYFLSDEVCLPTNDTAAANAFTEKIIRLPHSHLCYAPKIVRAMPPAGITAPCLKNGYVTFGSFNNFAKVTDETLLMWRAILAEVKNSRLVIKGKIASIPSGRKILRARLARLGFDQSKIELSPYSPDYLEQYLAMDIALDTMPYNGGLTTCEALYMGVPVISKRGNTHGSRFGASILTNAGVSELLAKNNEEYIDKAVRLGKNQEMIQSYHAKLRATMERSLLMNAASYMQELETAYLASWQNFCTI